MLALLSCWLVLVSVLGGVGVSNTLVVVGLVIILLASSFTMFNSSCRFVPLGFMEITGGEGFLFGIVFTFFGSVSGFLKVKVSSCLELVFGRVLVGILWSMVVFSFDFKNRGINGGLT